MMFVDERNSTNQNITIGDSETETMPLSLRKKRTFLQQTCLLSVMLLSAFTLGLAMGNFLPKGLTPARPDTNSSLKLNASLHNINSLYKLHKYDFTEYQRQQQLMKAQNLPQTINNNFISPTIYSSVSFISDEKYSTENILNSNDNRMLNNNDDYVMEANTNNHNDVESEHDGWQLSNSPSDKQLRIKSDVAELEAANNATLRQIVHDGIYWGPLVEAKLPQGYDKFDADNWESYMKTAEIVKIEAGCGRMQNRMVTFSDGVKACVRYRQNTDQIQGEIFSFYLGRLLNLTNLAPSTTTVVSLESRLWAQVKRQITESQWKLARPVVLTKWISDLEPSGIPAPFQPIDKHLNRDDIRNITLDDGTSKNTKTLIDRLKPKLRTAKEQSALRPKKVVLTDKMITKFVELAQWSDLIIFDYIIANLDRVVNNLYNFQWNADIMAAPAHNLAKQSATQLLVFLDNESGLLHGYRLLKKYEAYHSLLLDRLCVFRKSTIDALKALRDNDAGTKINEYFENATSDQLRESLPPLPEKSVKILTERIDRVLQQVQKCQSAYSER